MADTQNLGFGGANPYLQPTIDAALQDTVRNYNLTTQPAFNSAMVRSGSFGNSGIDQMNQESQRQLQTSLGQQANALRYGDYWNNQNFERTLFNDAFSQNQQNLQTGINLLGLQNQYNQQDLNNATAVQNTPLNYYQQFANQANSFGQGYGTQTQSMSGSGSPLTGALGGWQLGGALQKSWNPGGTPIMPSGVWGNGNTGYDTMSGFHPSFEM